MMNTLLHTIYVFPENTQACKMFIKYNNIYNYLYLLRLLHIVKLIE